VAISHDIMLHASVACTGRRDLPAENEMQLEKVVYFEDILVH